MKNVADNSQLDRLRYGQNIRTFFDSISYINDNVIYQDIHHVRFTLIESFF